MKTPGSRCSRGGVGRLLAVFLGSAIFAFAGSPALPASGPKAPVVTPDLSLANEVERAIDRGLAFLLSSQNPAGWWSTADHPAITGLALSAFLGHPRDRYRTNLPPALKKGLQYVVESAQPDGGIYRTSLANYNTAIAALALALGAEAEHRPIVQRARAFLARSQVDLGTPGILDSPFDGGVGYSDRPGHADLNNTLVALEALYHTRPVGEEAPPQELDWNAAIRFIQSCQNLPSHNSHPWVSHAPEDRGGFVYLPGESKAGGTTNLATGRVALRSYGSISYAGLLSYLYADLDRNDPRVVAVLDWLRAHYTLEENPALGLQGYYYYLHLMSKALATLQLDRLELKDGRSVDWRRALATRMFDLQRSDGAWVNANGRWWENDPVLVTAYAVLTLEFVYPGL